MNNKIVPQGYQQTEVGVIPQDWEVVRLGDVSNINPKNELLPNSFIYIDLESVNSGCLLKENFVFKRNAPSRAQRLMQKNDILFQMVRPYQKNNLFFELNGKYVASTGYAQIRAKENKKFLYYSVHSKRFVNNVISKSTGSNYPAINSSDLKNIKISLPPKPEQQKIADILTTWDNAIEKQTALIEKKQHLKKGLMQQLFSQKVRFNADDGSNFPDWEEKKLNNAGSFKSGTGFTETEQGGKSGVPFFKVSDMNLEGNQKVMILANNYVNDEQIERLNYKPINKKSVIFAKVGAAIFLERKRIADSFLIDNNMMAFTPTEGINFIRQWFDTVRLSKYAQIGALPSYNASDLKTIKINLPSLKEQQKIAQVLTLADNEINQLQTELALLKTQKKGLMQQLLTGKIRVKNIGVYYE